MEIVTSLAMLDHDKNGCDIDYHDEPVINDIQ